MKEGEHEPRSVVKKYNNKRIESIQLPFLECVIDE